MQETWKDIPGYEKMYQASNLGRIRSLDRYVKGNKNKLRLYPGSILKGTPDKDGYLKLSLSKENKQISFGIGRLVAKTFLENINNFKEINHKDGNKQNNSIDNLEWCTRSQNEKHAYDTGLIKKKFGEQHHNAKLTNEAVRVIRNSFTLTHQELANIFGVNRKCVGNIINFKNWRNTQWQAN